MTSRRPIGGKDPRVKADGEDDLTRLIRTIARQAAREAFNLVRDAFETPLAPAGSPRGPQNSKTGRTIRRRKRTRRPSQENDFSASPKWP